jgi:hypothetical protein
LDRAVLVDPIVSIPANGPENKPCLNPDAYHTHATKPPGPKLGGCYLLDRGLVSIIETINPASNGSSGDCGSIKAIG